ncbi:MAG: MerR family transcriptional regulator [Oscillospiraceae bacterium]
MKLSVSEVAAITEISVRTLHYYDEIHLLSPSEVTEAGYRYYDEAALRTLQEILFFRELDFPLKEIKELLTLPGYSRKRALKRQRKLLECKEQRLKELISLADKAIKGEKTMKNESTSFAEFSTTEMDDAKEKFAAEVKEKWGNTPAYQQSEERYATYSQEQKKDILEDADHIIKAFSELAGSDPASPAVQELVKDWQEYITQNHYRCTDEILISLAEMYVADERFQKNLDRFAPGTAKLMHDAILIHAV